MRPACAAALLAPAFLAASCATASPPGSSLFDRLPGWAEEDHAAALAAYQAGCGVAADPAAQEACREARALGRADEGTARRFFERRFRPEPIAGEGLLTGYYAPEYEARPTPDGVFSAPLRTTPVASDRADVERSAPEPATAAWLRPEDLFFLQIQGSGTLLFPDGRRMRTVYAGDNGRPYWPIGRTLLSEGQLRRDQLDAGSIHAWLAAHRGPEADAVMDQNPRYIFFKLVGDDRREPEGAAGMRLIPGRSLAVDPGSHGYGELLWIDAAQRPDAPGSKPYRRLAVALDKGAAIQGELRADLYLGRGEQAGADAGLLKDDLHLVRLVPGADEAVGR